eukprot:8691490-Alexandrium_andersonii.AAC.2
MKSPFREDAVQNGQQHGGDLVRWGATSPSLDAAPPLDCGKGPPHGFCSEVAVVAGSHSPQVRADRGIMGAKAATSNAADGGFRLRAFCLGGTSTVDAHSPAPLAQRCSHAHVPTPFIRPGHSRHAGGEGLSSQAALLLGCGRASPWEAQRSAQDLPRRRPGGPTRFPEAL